MDLFEWVLPHYCVFCHQKSGRGVDLCVACERELPWIETFCYRCGRPLDVGTFICGQCLKEPPLFDRVIPLFRYEPPISLWISKLKFRKQLVFAKLLGTLFAERLLQVYCGVKKPDLIIPVPLHRDRLRSRGFNQSLEIARPIARALGVPIDISSCIRSKYTQPQTLMSPMERKTNLQNAFSLRKSLEVSHVAIIDDVLTSGETVNHLCQVLKKRACMRIDVWCIARTSHP